MHICVSNLTIIGSDHGLSPGRRQAIIWTNVGILLIGPLGTNFSEIWIGIAAFSFKKMRLKMSSAKSKPFCFVLHVLRLFSRIWYFYNNISLGGYVSIVWYQPLVWKCIWMYICAILACSTHRSIVCMTFIYFDINALHFLYCIRHLDTLLGLYDVEKCISIYSVHIYDIKAISTYNLQAGFCTILPDAWILIDPGTHFRDIVV